METKTIPGFSRYLVTRCGHIWSEHKGAIMRSGTDDRGYRRQPLKSDSGKVVCVYLHRVVAQAFLPAPIGDACEVDHIDGDPRNNDASNLRWLAHAENIRSAIERRGNWLANTPKRSRAFVRIDPEGGTRVKFETADAAISALNALIHAKGGTRLAKSARSNVFHAAKSGGVAYGFRWELAELTSKSAIPCV
jgi:HNH endonuclease